MRSIVLFRAAYSLALGITASLAFLWGGFGATCDGTFSWERAFRQTAQDIGQRDGIGLAFALLIGLFIFSETRTASVSPAGVRNALLVFLVVLFLAALLGSQVSLCAGAS